MPMVGDWCYVCAVTCKMRLSVTLIDSCYFGMWTWGAHLVTRKIWFFDQPKKGIHLCRMILWLDRLMTLECNDVFIRAQNTMCSRRAQLYQVLSAPLFIYLGTRPELGASRARPGMLLL